MTVAIHLSGPISDHSWCGTKLPLCCVYRRDQTTCQVCLRLEAQRSAEESKRKGYVESHDMTDWHPITYETLPLSGSWLFWDGDEVELGSIEQRNAVSGVSVIWIGSSAHSPFEVYCRLTHYRSVPAGPGK